MARTVVVAAAQTGPVSQTAEPAIVAAAIAMIDEARAQGVRLHALKGAEPIAMPIAFSVYANPAQRSSIWEVPLRARAYENGLFVLAANRVGLEGVRQHLGRSMLVDPLGMIRCEAGVSEPQLLVSEIDLDEAVRARAGLAWWPDRRPDLYGPLVA